MFQKSFFFTITFIVCSFSIGFSQGQQEPCEFPPVFSPGFLDENGGCGGLLGIPENPTWAEMNQAASGLTSNDNFFENPNGEGLNVGDLQNETTGWGNGTAGSPPISSSNVTAFGNMIDENVDIGALIECLNINCLVEHGSFELSPDAADFINGISNMDPTEFQNLMEDAGNDSGTDYYDFFTVDVPNNQGYLNDLVTNLNGDLGGLDFNDLAESFYGVGGTPDEPCDVLPEGVTDKADLDLFSTKVKGLSELGLGNFTPGPSGMDVISEVQAGVNLYNGNADATIPITSMTSNDISLNVKLSHDGTGVKVNELGGDLGLNWDLKAGGAITRVVKGVPDDFFGTTNGKGRGPVPVLKPCVDITGAGVNFFAPHKTVAWSPVSPHVLKFYVTVASGVFIVPIGPITITIPWYVSIEISVKLNVRYKPGVITYEEKFCGLDYLDDPNKLEEFDGLLNDLNEIDIADFSSLSPFQKEKILRLTSSSNGLDDFRFLRSDFEAIISFWEGLDNLFTGDLNKVLRRIDLEPDEFYFSFEGYSGKFVFDQNGNIHTIPKTELLIEEIKGEHPDLVGRNEGDYLMGFKVTTPEGLVYHFGKIDGKGVEYIEKFNYVLPNSFTYPETTQTPLSNDPLEFGGSQIDETSLPFKGMVSCWPRSLLYGSTYEKNYNVTTSPVYTSTWKLTKVTSLLTDEEVTLDYQKREDIVYYSNKSLSHRYPNFKPSYSPGSKFTTEQHLGLSPQHYVTNTEWQNGKATLNYFITEDHLCEWDISAINGQRGENIKFLYDEEQRPDLLNDFFLEEIQKWVGGQFSKGWVFELERTEVSPDFSCVSIEDGTTQPVYSVPQEFSFDLGTIRQKHHFRYFKWVYAFMGIGNAPVSEIGISIPKPHPGFLLPPIFEKNEDIHSILSEFGSLVTIKNDIGDLDIELEKEIFKKENQRALLNNVFEKDRQGNIQLLVNLAYNGNLTDIPKRFSLSQDLWGHFNDNEASILPFMSYEGENGVAYDVESNFQLEGHFSFENTNATGTVLGHNESASLEKAKIGALEKITFITGGEKRFFYELNDWPLEDGTSIPGAGIRVSKLEEDPIDSPPKVTTYIYSDPTIVNRPVRKVMHEENLDAYGVNHFVETSSSPFNEWLMNKNNYVGYGIVTEKLGGGEFGEIEHRFITPEDDTIFQPEVRVLNKNMNTLVPILASFTQGDQPAGQEYYVPEMPLIPRDWRFGLEDTTIFRNSSGETVQFIERLFEARGSEEQLVSNGIRTKLFQENDPGSWACSNGLGLIANLIPQGGNEMMQVISAILNQVAVLNPCKEIRKHYYWSHYQYPTEEFLLIWEREKNYFYPDNNSSSVVSSTTTYNYSFFPSNSSNGYSRLTNKIQTFSNQQSTSSSYYYVDPQESPSIFKMDNFAGLESIGLAGYGVPLRTEVKVNGTLVDGSIMAMLENATTTDPGKVFPSAYWTVRNGVFQLEGKVSQWHSSTRPEKYEIADFVSGGNEVSDYTFSAPAIEFVWNNDLTLKERIRDQFKETYAYNSYQELISHTDPNSVLSTYEYDDFGRLEKTISANGRVTTEYNYELADKLISTQTIYSDGTPTQGITQNYNGLGMPLFIERHDGAILNKKTYDSQFRVQKEEDLTTGETTFEYEASPLSRLLMQTDAVGNTFEYVYEGAVGEYPDLQEAFTKVTTTDPNDHESVEISDALGGMLRTISAEGSTTTYQYDSQRRLEKIENPIGEDYTYTYNSIGGVMSKAVPVGGTTELLYDERLRLAASQDANGNLLLYEYDNYDRLLSVYHYDGSASISNYNQLAAGSGMVAISEIASDFDPNFAVRQNEYDPTNSHTWLLGYSEDVFSVNGNGNITSDFTGIDDIGRITSVAETYPGGFAIMNNTVYNDANLVVKQSSAVNGPEQVNIFSEMEYDGVLRLKESLLSTQSPQNMNSIAKLGYNGKDLVSTKFLGGSLQKVDYMYDAAGRLIAINSPGEMECFEEDEFCMLHAEFTLFEAGAVGQSSCQYLTGVEINGVFYPFSQVLNLHSVSDIALLEGELESAIFNSGIFGDLSVYSSQVPGGFTFKIRIENTNATSISLIFQNCGFDIPFVELDCCNDSPPVSVSGTNFDVLSPNPDLFYEFLVYEGLDIKMIELGADCSVGYMRNIFSYDGNHRVTEMKNIFYNPLPVFDSYNTSYSYDLAGNINTITRNGLVDFDVNQNPIFGPIDDLVFSYSGTGSSELAKVEDDPLLVGQQKGFRPSTSNFSYDSNGNLTLDDGKTILGVQYGPNNLPTTIPTVAGEMRLDHTLSGQKIRKETTGANGEVRLYLDGVEFVDGEAEAYYHPEGRVVLDGDIYQYHLKDHLGNTVVLFEDDGDGTIITEQMAAAQGIPSEVLQRQYYYPFGLQMEGVWNDEADPRMDFLYNGKELEEDFGINLLAYGARHYDPVIGRFTGVDPLASKMPGWSPNTYTFNNPLQYIDPSGLAPALPPNDYFDTNGNYIGSDNKGDEIRIIENYDNSSDLFSQSSVYSDNYMTPEAHANILSFYGDQNGLCNMEFAAMPNGLSNEMEVRQSNGKHAGGWYWEDRVISVSLNPLGTWGEYEGKTNIQSRELNNLYSYQSILLHEADHYGDFSPLANGGFKNNFYRGESGILRHMEIYRNQIQHAYFELAPKSFQKVTYGYMQAIGNESTNPKVRAQVISIINSVVPAEYIQIK
jgi:RHS repeat-associated protein